jgi:hypothetical protein
LFPSKAPPLFLFFEKIQKEKETFHHKVMALAHRFFFTEKRFGHAGRDTLEAQ